MVAIRALLALANEFDLDIRQVDIVGAYLQAKNSHIIYMRQPTGFVVKNKEHMVYLLIKCLYGLKQSGREWHHTLRAWLLSLGFIQMNSEGSCFMRIIDGKMVVVSWHVDDGLLVATKGYMERVIEELKKGSFQVTDLGEPKYLLGCKIDRDRLHGVIKISQPAYIDTIVSRLGLSLSRTVNSPMEYDSKAWSKLIPRLKDSGPDPEMVDRPYAAALGSLNWCAVATRPDIAYAVSRLGSYSNNPSIDHWEAILRVAKYLKGTRDVGITFRRHGGLLKGYADADWANDLADRTSYSGWVFLLNGSPISWSTRKQQSPALSSMEAEFHAITSATQEAIWIQRFLTELGLNQPAVPLHVDSEPAEAFIRNDVARQRTKHIDTKFHFVRHHLEAGSIAIHHCSSVDNAADLFTKPLGPYKHSLALRLIGMLD